MCDAGYEGEYCDRKTSDYSMLVLLLVAANVVVAFMWYSGRVGLCSVWFVIHVCILCPSIHV